MWFQRNRINSIWNQIVFTILRLIWNQTDVRLVPNQSENGKYNLISVWFNKISRRFICVCDFSEIYMRRNSNVITPGFFLAPKLKCNYSRIFPVHAANLPLIVWAVWRFCPTFPSLFGGSNVMGLISNNLVWNVILCIVTICIYKRSSIVIK